MLSLEEYYGLDNEDKVRYLEELINKVHKAISYEKGKSSNDALNAGMELMEHTFPNLQDHL